MRNEFGFEGVLPFTASDTVDITVNGQKEVSRYIHVSVAGTLRVTMTDGSQADLTVTAGTQLYLRVKRVHVTGTTATVVLFK